jgi:hypothetical protein
MSIATFSGIVENGQIRLLDGVRLPEKAKVYIIVPSVESPTSAHVGSPRLADPAQAADFVKKVAELPRASI